MECGHHHRGKVTVYTSQAPLREGQKLGENEKDNCGPSEVNSSKPLGSANK